MGTGFGFGLIAGFAFFGAGAFLAFGAAPISGLGFAFFFSGAFSNFAFGFVAASVIAVTTLGSAGAEAVFSGVGDVCESGPLGESLGASSVKKGPIALDYN